MSNKDYEFPPYKMYPLNCHYISARS